MHFVKEIMKYIRRINKIFLEIILGIMFVFNEKMHVLELIKNCKNGTQTLTYKQ